MTKENKIYQVKTNKYVNIRNCKIQPFLEDLVHTEDGWPSWMDTVGLDEGDAEDVNGELVQKIMNFLLHSLKVQVLGAQIPVDIAKVWS